MKLLSFRTNRKGLLSESSVSLFDSFGTFNLQVFRPSEGLRFKSFFKEQLSSSSSWGLRLLNEISELERDLFASLLSLLVSRSASTGWQLMVANSGLCRGI